ncbi:pyridoxamine 5'-phosphate oxidase family protein, partial [Lacticaseibacillus rhamnosus]
MRPRSSTWRPARRSRSSPGSSTRHTARRCAPGPSATSASAAQTMDASPRGGAPGFIKTLDAHTLLIPDAPGNNRLDTLENILETGKLGLLFMIPGVDETLRVNGAASLSRRAEHLRVFAGEKRTPNLVIAVTV